MLFAGRQLSGVKLVKEALGCTLMEARRYVSRERVPFLQKHRPHGFGAQFGGEPDIQTSSEIHRLQHACSLLALALAEYLKPYEHGTRFFEDPRLVSATRAMDVLIGKVLPNPEVDGQRSMEDGIARLAQVLGR